jgi:outer membrane immunogenic protein
MKKILLGVAVAIALGAGTAAADGIDRRPSPIAAPQPIYAPTWSGFYIGAGIGAGAVVHDLDISADGGSLLNFNGIGGEGIFGTAIIGADWQIGSKAVVGVFADYDFSDISTDLTVLDGLFRASIDHNNSWSVGARLGWLATPSTLIYALGGYTEAEFEASARTDGVNLFSADKTFSGYFVGAGIDTRLGATNWFARLEYRYTEFDSESIFSVDDVLNVDIEPSMHTGRLTLTYKFNSGWGNWGAGSWGKY